jgi:dihydroxyacetone kinase-like protein
MDSAELLRILDMTLSEWANHSDTLAQLDAAAGDGDMGITVSRGAAKVRESLSQLAIDTPEPSLAEILRIAGMAFARGNPSTLAALVGSGLLSAASAASDSSAPGRATVLVAAEAAAERIMERGGAKPGDKTLLDSLVPSVRALAVTEGDETDVILAMINSARAGVEKTTDMVSRAGRAAWIGERGVGVPDAGATAWLLFLECLQGAWRQEDTDDILRAPATSAGTDLAS